MNASLLLAGPELITLDMGEVMDPEIAQSLKEAANIGKSKFTEFVASRIEKATKPLSDVIQRSNLYTFTNKPPTDLKKGSDKLGSSKANTVKSTTMTILRGNVLKHYIYHRKITMSKGKIILKM